MVDSYWEGVVCNFCTVIWGIGVFYLWFVEVSRTVILGHDTEWSFDRKFFWILEFGDLIVAFLFVCFVFLVGTGEEFLVVRFCWRFCACISRGVVARVRGIWEYCCFWRRNVCGHCMRSSLCIEVLFSVGLLCYLGVFLMCVPIGWCHTLNVIQKVQSRSIVCGA